MEEKLPLIRQVRNVLLWLGVLPCMASAAGLSDPGFDQIPVLAYFVTLLSSTLGSLAGTLHRLARYLEQGSGALRHPKMFVVTNIVGGWTAGWFVFFVSTHLMTPVLMVQGLVLLAGFAGAAILEKMVDQYFPGGSVKVDSAP